MVQKKGITSSQENRALASKWVDNLKAGVTIWNPRRVGNPLTKSTPQVRSVYGLGLQLKV